VGEPTQKEGKRVPADPDSSAGIDAAAYGGLVPLPLILTSSAQPEAAVSAASGSNEGITR